MGESDWDPEAESGENRGAPGERNQDLRQVSEPEQVAALEAEIAGGKARVASSLSELQTRWRRATSWRHWVGAHPVAWICAGVCLGLIVGRRARRS